ncbi:hypothetical protein NW767_014893 [Fusarium falciforme]|nr:hypothetical protein NW767_014893 [Fusarium falciforme]
MAPTTDPSQVTRTKTSRRRRSEQNRNPGAGMRNRQRGLAKKAHTFFRFYGGQVALVVKREDGRIGGYESHVGLIREFAKASIPVGEFLGPEDFDKERSDTPETTSQLDELTACVSPPSRTPSLHGTSSTDLSDTPSSSTTSATESSVSTALPQQSSIDAEWSTKKSPRKTFRSRPPLKSHRALQSRPISTRLRLALMSFLDSCLA